MWIARRPDQNRAEEDEARAFFDLHGRWPDEPPEAAGPLGPPPVTGIWSATLGTNVSASSADVSKMPLLLDPNAAT